MTESGCSQVARRWLWLLAILASTAGSGCMNSIYKAIPARRLPPHLQARSKDIMQPVDLAALRRSPVTPRRIVPGDILGIHIQNVLAKDNEPPSVNFFGTEKTDVVQPAVGSPVEVQDDGFIDLPLVPQIQVAGLTVVQARERIRQAYQKQDILQPQRDRIVVTLMKPRIHQVMVVREDTAAPAPSLVTQNSFVISKRGSAQVLDLPAYENDVLRALSLTGGLPGQDGENEVYVLRGNKDESWSSVIDRLNDGVDPMTLQRAMVRVPLRLNPGQPLPFTEQDITLGDGDVVFIPSRDQEYFHAAGLLPTNPIPLPRDYDLDIIGAITLAGGAAASPAGFNAVAFSFRNGPGNIVPPSRVIIVRTLPNGKQFKIYCNLKRAFNNPRERVLIQGGDIVLLQYTPAELATLIGINFVTFSFAIPNGH